MAHSQRSGRLRTTRRARRPDGRIYRTLRMRRPGGRRGRAGVWVASAVLLLLTAAVWLLLWR